MQIQLKLILVLFIFLSTKTFAVLTLTNTSPDVADASKNISTFEIKLSIDDIKTISLGDTIDIQLPGNLPKLSSQDDDDGKLYVLSSFKNKDDTKYKGAPGLKISIYEHMISIRVTSMIQTFTQDDEYSNIVPMQDGDIITFELSSDSDVSNKANAQYSGEEDIKATTSSSSLKIINNTKKIITPSLELKITNPSVVFDRQGLGAKSNPRFNFFFKGGLPADTRIEINFPNGFDIRALHKLSNYILINEKYKTSNAFVNGQKLSFILDEKVEKDNLYIDIISFRVTNSTSATVKPFKIKIYKNNETYENNIDYPYAKTDETYFVNSFDDEYSLNDEIHIEFSKPIMTNLITPSIITLEKDDKNATFGSNYTIKPTNYEHGYASKFKITLGIDTNLTKNLDINFSKDAIFTKFGYQPLKDIVFQVPSTSKTKTTAEEKTILQTHTKLFASSDIDMLYKAMNSNLPDKATFNDLIFEDKDEDGTYSKGDTFTLTFSKLVYYPYIEDISSILTLSSDMSLGIDAKIVRVEQNNKLYHAKYKLTLGFNPKLKVDDIIVFNRVKIRGEDGSVPIFDVAFSALPDLNPPIGINKIKVQDNDNNDLYSSGDKLSIEFSQPIKSIDLKDLSLLSENVLDAKYIIYENTTEGYSSKFSIKLGENTQLKQYDKLLIPKNVIINKHGIKSGENESIYFDIPSLSRVNLNQLKFNPNSNTLSLEFNKELVEINKDELAKKILITFNDTENTIASMKDNIISLVQNNKFIYIVFNSQFISSLKEAKLGIKIPKNTLALKESLRLNKEIVDSFYTTIKIKNLVANSWNLVALEDNLVDTSIKYIKNTGKVNQIYAFDTNKKDWVFNDDEIIQRGMAIWVNPKESTIDNIIGMKPKNNFKEKTSLLNIILHMKNDEGYFIGNSVKDCTKESNFNLQDIKPILLNTVQAKIITFDANTTLYNEKATFVKPCQGFIVIKSLKP